MVSIYAKFGEVLAQIPNKNAWSQRTVVVGDDFNAPIHMQIKTNLLSLRVSLNRFIL